VFLLEADFAMTALDLISRVSLTSLFSGHPHSRFRIFALCFDDIMDIVCIFIAVNLHESLFDACYTLLVHGDYQGANRALYVLHRIRCAKIQDTVCVSFGNLCVSVCPIIS
jgi:hypothetical protein